MKSQVLVRFGVVVVLFVVVLLWPPATGFGEFPSTASASADQVDNAGPSLQHLGRDGVVRFGPCMLAERVGDAFRIEQACTRRGTWNSTGGCGGNYDSCCSGGGGAV